VTVTVGAKLAVSNGAAEGLYAANVEPATLWVTETEMPPAVVSLTPNPVQVDVPPDLARRADFGNVALEEGEALIRGRVYSDTHRDGAVVVGIDRPLLYPGTVLLDTAAPQATNDLYAYVTTPGAHDVAVDPWPLYYEPTAPNPPDVALTAVEQRAVSQHFGFAFGGLGGATVYLPLLLR
jgi:hypothetical protein